MTPDADRRVCALAGRQAGVVTREQALAAGWSTWTIRRRVRAGFLRELHPGVYAVGIADAPGAGETAALLAAGGGALLSHRTAAVRWGFARPVRGEPVHLTLVGTGRGRIRGLRTHRVRVLEPDERAERDGFPLTSPGRTLLDVAHGVSPGELEDMLAQAERSDLVPATAWPDLLTRYRGRPGVRALAAAMGVPGGPALTRSEAERVLLGVVRRAGLPRPELNAKLGPWEIDFLWRSEGLAVEVDGYMYHRTRRDFERDRSKDAWLMARGLRVVRLTWRQLDQAPMATAVLLAQALAHGVPEARMPDEPRRGSSPAPGSRPGDYVT